MEAETEGCRLFIPVTINDRKGRFLLDPSRSHSIIDLGFAGAMEGGYGIPSFYGVAFLDTLKVGDILFKDIRLPVGDAQMGDLLDQVDGIIGVDFLIQVKATLSLRDKKVIFDAPRPQLDYKPDGRAKVFNTAIL